MIVQTVQTDRDGDYRYIGWAKAGAEDSDPVWWIVKVSTWCSLELAANGSLEYNNRWTDRKNLNYRRLGDVGEQFN